MNQGEKQDEGLVYDPKWQEAVFGHMLTDLSFFLKSKTYVQKHFFQNPRIGQLYQLLLDFEKDIGRFPKNPEEFQSYKIASILDSEEKKRYNGALASCLVSSRTIALDLIIKSMNVWIKRVLLKEALVKSGEKYTGFEHEAALEQLKKSIDQISTASFTDDKFFEFGKLKKIYENIEESNKNSISTGDPILDSLLVGEKYYTDEFGIQRQYPGLIRKELTVIAGPLNSGKSQVGTTIARHCIKNKKRVIMLTHEGHTEQHADRLIRCLLFKNPVEISSWMSDPKNEADVYKIGMELAEYINYCHYAPSNGIYVEDVIAIIKSKAMQMETAGKPVDLIINDYPGLLLSRNLGNKVETRILMAYCYRQMANLAGELNCHVISMAQINREGSRRAKEGEGLLETEDIGEAFGIGQIADNVISINRSKEDQKNHYVRLNIAKSRSSDANHYYWSRTDLSRATMFMPLKLASGKAVYGTPPDLTMNRVIDAHENKIKEERSRQEIQIESGIMLGTAQIGKANEVPEEEGIDDEI